MKVNIKISDGVLDEKFCRDFVSHPTCGGIVTFTGTVRNQTNGKKVLALEFEARESMAKQEMKKIAEFVLNQWDICKIAIHHRVGRLAINEVPVIICVSSPHRKSAFEACQYAMDTLKKTVPIWKKEIFEDGEIWVAAHP